MSSSPSNASGVSARSLAAILAMQNRRASTARSTAPLCEKNQSASPDASPIRHGVGFPTVRG